MLSLDSVAQLLDHSHESAKLSDVQERSHRHGPQLREDERRNGLTVNLHAHCLLDFQSRHHDCRLFGSYFGKKRHEFLRKDELVQGLDHHEESLQRGNLH